MDSNETGPPPKKRYMNGNQEGQASFESRGSGHFRGSRRGQGSRGVNFSRGRGGFRGGFRGRGSDAGPRDESSGFRGRGGSPFRGGRGSTPFRGRGRSNSLSSPDDQSPGVQSPGVQSPGFRGGRGRSRSSGSSPGFRGRGGAPSFRGRGFSVGFRGRRGAPGLRGRGGAPGFRGRGGAPGFFPGREFSLDHGSRHVITIYNLPDSKKFIEQKEFVQSMLSDYNCMNVDIIKQGSQFSKAKCRLKDENSVQKACQDLNGNFVEEGQILVAGYSKSDPRCIPIVITNLPQSPTHKDLAVVLHDCKSIAQISEINVQAASPYVFVHVFNEDDVERIIGKSLTEIQGSKIVIKRLHPSLVARSEKRLLFNKWEKLLGTDTTYYINIKLQYTDIYFESLPDLEEGLRKAAVFDKEGKEKVALHKRTDVFFAEVCGAKGDIDDVELYSLMRKHGEISEFKRLDKDFYMVKQDLSAGMAAMSLSDSKACGGVLKFSWLNTRVEKEAEVVQKKKKNKKKKNKAGATEAEGKDSADTKVAEEQVDEEMAEDGSEHESEYEDVVDDHKELEEAEEEEGEELDSSSEVAETEKLENKGARKAKSDKVTLKQQGNNSRKRKISLKGK